MMAAGCMNLEAFLVALSHRTRLANRKGRSTVPASLPSCRQAGLP